MISLNQRLGIGVLLLLCLSVFAADAPTPPPVPSKISSPEWEARQLEFREKYASRNPAIRIKAIQIITPLWGYFESDRDRRQAVQLILRVIAQETDNTAAEAAVSCFLKMTTDYAAIRWLNKDYDNIILTEAGKLRFIRALGQMTSYQKDAVAIFAGLSKSEESTSQIKIAIIEASGKFPVYLSYELLVNLVSDANSEVAISALSTLTKAKNAKAVPLLIDRLSVETRKTVRNTIAQTLESITGQGYGTASRKWQKWWQTSTEVPQSDINAAIGKAKDFILSQLQKQALNLNQPKITDELTFYALLHTGIPLAEPIIQDSLEQFMTKKLERTYNVALLAQALCYLDRAKYQPRIIQCAQCLLANQSRDGNWSYGTACNETDITPVETADSAKPVLTDNKQTTSTQTVKKIRIKIPPRRKDAAYDNSNTQYALLGLKACAEADIEIPQDTWADAEKHLLRTQSGDGGWTYTLGGYSYGSMTAGGLGGLAICKFYQNKKIKEDPDIKKAVDWLDKNFTVMENPGIRGNPTSWHYYYLYGLQRAGVLSETESFGTHNWYNLGARFLIIEQDVDGSWNKNAQDTCFAILFLSRATKPLTAIKFIETPK